MAEQPPILYPTAFASSQVGASSGYVNRAASSFSAFDFTFTFLRSTPVLPASGEDESEERVELVSQLIMSPQYAKSLAALLHQNVASYEAHFGPIQAEGASSEASG